MLWQWLSFILMGWSNPVYFGKHSWSGCRSCLQPHHCRNLKNIHRDREYRSNFNSIWTYHPTPAYLILPIYYMKFIINVSLLFRVFFLVQTSLFRILKNPHWSHSRKFMGCQWTTKKAHLRSLPLQLHSETERVLLQPGSKTIQKLPGDPGDPGVA